jgi:hypothetical protein
MTFWMEFSIGLQSHLVLAFFLIPIWILLITGGYIRLNKKKNNETIKWYKAWFIAKSYHQYEGIDVEETFNLVVKLAIQFWLLLFSRDDLFIDWMFIVVSCMSSDDGYSSWIKGVLEVLGINHKKIWLIVCKSHHLVLWSLRNLIVCESLGKWTSCVWKKYISLSASYLWSAALLIDCFFFFLCSCFYLLVCLRFKKSLHW